MVLTLLLCFSVTFGNSMEMAKIKCVFQVAVCAPSRLSTYLNITLKNISKVVFVWLHLLLFIGIDENFLMLDSFHFQVITNDTPVLPKPNDSETSAKNPVPVNGKIKFSF